MTVLSSKLIDQNYDLVNRDGIHRATYEVKTDIRNQSGRLVVQEAQSASPDPVPAYFATFALLGDADVNAFCQSIKHKRKDINNSTTHFIGCEWSPITGDPSDDYVSGSNPLVRPVRTWGGWETIQVPVEAGWNKEYLTGIGRSPDTYGPIQDAAGQEPSTPIMKPKRIPVIYFQKNYATLTEMISLGLTYGDALNDASWYGIPEGEALYRGIDMSQPKYGGGIEYYSGTHIVAVQEGGWDYAMVNRGWKYLGDDPNNPGTTILLEPKITDDQGAKVSIASPQNLQLDGSLTPDGQVGTIINWRTSPKINFSGIGIGA